MGIIVSIRYYSIIYYYDVMYNYCIYLRDSGITKTLLSANERRKRPMASHGNARAGSVVFSVVQMCSTVQKIVVLINQTNFTVNILSVFLFIHVQPSSYNHSGEYINFNV